MEAKPTQYRVRLTVNGNLINTVLVGRHYLIKHASYMNDALILDLVAALDGRSFPVDSTTAGIEYYAADVVMNPGGKIYRVIWLFEGGRLEVLGVINAYRRSKKKENPSHEEK